MICNESERLESLLIDNRTAQRKPNITDEERDALLSKEPGLIMDIKEHQSAGHDGEPCPGE